MSLLRNAGLGIPGRDEDALGPSQAQTRRTRPRSEEAQNIAELLVQALHCAMSSATTVGRMLWRTPRVKNLPEGPMLAQTRFRCAGSNVSSRS